MTQTTKRTLVLALGALGLLGAGALGRRSASAPARAEVPAPSPAVEVQAASAAPLPPATRPEANRALLIARLVSEVQSAEQAASGRPTPAQEELSASKERQARSEAGGLSQSLRAEPGAWNDVIDFLICFEPAEAAIKVARMLQNAVDPAAERRLVGTLRRQDLSTARRVALALVGRREGGDVLSAVLSALDDPDPRLRSEVLEILAERRANPDSPTTAATVDAALRRQATTDPDRNLQNVARSLLGEAVASPAPPPRRSPLSIGSAGSKPKPAAGATAGSP